MTKRSGVIVMNVPWLRSFLVNRRRQAVVLAAVAIGIVTGALVAAFDAVTANVLLKRVASAPLAVMCLVPMVGLALAALILRFVAGGADATTADAYVDSYHERSRPMPLRPVFGRVLASIATLGSGGAMGFEGPATYIGAAVGSALPRRFRRLFRDDEMKSLLVAGAAGGLAAIFKTPATGVLFALEVPYHDDIARNGLVPSLVAAAASYLTYVTLLGTRPLLSLSTSGSGFAGIELIGAAIVGLAAGLGARMFVWFMERAQHIAHTMSAWRRIILSGGGLALLALLSHRLFGVALSIGPGYRTFAWMTSPDRALGLIAALFVIRLLAVTLTVSGGGAGGMFIPLVIQGAVLGRLVAGGLDAAGLHTAAHPAVATSLFPILGIAAFLGAGYRTPLAGVMFVAESTGKAVFVVPALIAAAISQLFMANSSVSPGQRGRRTGHLESRFTLPISAALLTDVLTLPPDATLTEFVSNHVVPHRQRAAVVVDGSHYLGLCALRDVVEIPRAEWDDTLVTDVMRSDVPAAVVTWLLRDALAVMEVDDVDRLGVVDIEGHFIGELRRSEIFRLDELLDDTST